MENVQFPALLLKNLVDRSQDKRQDAARELSEIAQKCARQNAAPKIKKFIKFFLDNYIKSTNLVQKKAGLKALIAIATTVLKYQIVMEDICDDIVNAVLVGVEDNTDAKARFAGLEALSNLSRILEGKIINHLNVIFSVLMGKICDCDDDVKGAAMHYNNQLKTHVNENLVASQSMLFSFIQQVAHHMEASNPSIKMFLLDWLLTLNEVPGIDIILYLPLFLYELLKFTGDKSSETKKKAEKLETRIRDEFKQWLKTDDLKLMCEDLESVAGIIVKCTNVKMFSSHTILRAMEWLNVMLETLLFNLQGDIKKGSELQQAIIGKLSSIFDCILRLLTNDEESIRAESSKGNKSLSKILNNIDQSLDISQVYPFVREMLSQKQAVQANQSFAVWMCFLLGRPNKQTVQFEHLLFKLLQKIIKGDPTITDLFLKLNFHISYFELVIDTLLKVVAEKQNQFTCSEIEPVLTKLCSSVGAEETFRTVSKHLRTYTNSNFILQMLGFLTRFLVTSPILQGVRQHLRNNRTYFQSVFQNWAFEVTSAVTLCLIGGQYILARQILSLYETRPITQSTQIQLYKLASLLESPNFTYLRLQLLQPQSNFFLIEALSALLMIIPQGKAFTNLKNRLSLVRASEGKQKAQIDSLLSKYISISDSLK